MNRANKHTHRLDFIFVLSLFTVFAATALVLVLIGAKQYKLTASKMNYNYRMRTTSSYLTQKIRQYDTSDQVEVVSLDGTDALALHTNINDVEYIDYIYYFDGWLRELLVSENSVYDLKAGEIVIEANDFTPTIYGNDLIYIELKDDENYVHKIYVNLTADAGKEAL